jgi:aspartokinase-like uncharacterized kinase
MSDVPPVIVKVGGSLFDLPDLGVRLEAWLKTLHRREIILVPGGGAVADAVREMDKIHGLAEEASHWLALRALHLTAHLLLKLAPTTLSLVILLDSRLRSATWAQGKTPVIDPLAFAGDDEGHPGALPHRWDVTSDSLAARVVEVLEAEELVLLKSVTIPPALDWAEASRRGFVDAYFPTMIARGVKARAVNLRDWQP